MIDIVKFDGKHWVERRSLEGPLELKNYESFAKQAGYALKEGGIVAIPNARCDEYRFEELRRLAGSDVKNLGDGRIFHNPKYNVWSMKAQEINTKHKNIPLTFLVYNMPFNENLDDKSAEQVLQDAKEKDCIIGITGPSCVGGLEKVFNELQELESSLDFFVGYSGSSAVKFGTNRKAINFWKKYLKDKGVGVISVSGGHRTPETKLDYLKNGFRPTVGRCYTRIGAPNVYSQEEFIKSLRENLNNSTKKDLKRNPFYAETMRHLLLWGVWDKLKGKR